MSLLERHHGLRDFGYTRAPGCEGAASEHVPRLLDIAARPLREANSEVVARLPGATRLVELVKRTNRSAERL